MAPASSSGSWCGAGGAGAVTAPDIIDLDHYMRGTVRPSQHMQSDDEAGPRFVVDAGGITRQPAPESDVSSYRASVRRSPQPNPKRHQHDTGRTPAVESDVSSYHVAVRQTNEKRRSHNSERTPVAESDLSSYHASVRRPIKPNTKRYSHDSGLSDGSYRRKKHRIGKYERVSPADKILKSDMKQPTSAESNNSLRAFRAACERTLREQQAQLARVAQIIEQRSEPRVERSKQKLDRAKPRARTKRVESSETSDITSSSRSTGDLGNKDRHRTQECKTYKIIMTKLDELNRLFAERKATPQHRVESPRAPIRPSNGGDRAFIPRVGQINSSVVERAVGGSHNSNNADQDKDDSKSLLKDTMESVTRESSKSLLQLTSDENHVKNYHLDDPVKFYEQSKRIVFHTRPAHPPRVTSSRVTSRMTSLGTSRSPSLCALCRRYCRALSHYLFCFPPAL